MRNILGFKPQLIPTLFAVPALILLISLSIWQFQRLHWKQDLIKTIKTQSTIAPIELQKDINSTEMLYRNVIIKGNFKHNEEIHIYGGSRKFKGEVGYYILTPMHLTDGRIIIVNRGWVPKQLKESSSRPETLIKGPIEITGALMKSEEKGSYIHDNQLEYNLWFYVNLMEIKNFLNIPDDIFINNFYLLAKENNDSNILPYGRNLEPNIRNHHLEYALTWLFSAISLVVIYIMYHRKK